MDTQTLDERRRSFYDTAEAIAATCGEENAMSTTATAMGSFYDEKRAASELRKYRERGPIPSTRALIEALAARKLAGAVTLEPVSNAARLTS